MNAPAVMDEVTEVSAALRSYLDSLPSAGLLKDGEAELVYGMAYRLFEQGRYERARDYLRLLTSCQPTVRKYWMSLAACHRKLGHFDAAILAYSTVAVSHPDSPESSLKVAECLLQEGKVGDAVETLKAVIEYCALHPAAASIGTRARAVLQLLQRVPATQA